MKRKRGVPKVAADNENAVIIVPQETDKTTPEPEDPAVVEWNAFAQDHYELVEQLPLSLHRSYSLMRELDELAQNNHAMILPATKAYISLRESLARKPKHKRVPSGLDLLAHVSASVEPPTTAAPVPNLAPDGQPTALEAVNGMLNGQEVAESSVPTAPPTTTTSAPTESGVPVVEPPPPSPGSTISDSGPAPQPVQNGVPPDAQPAESSTQAETQTFPQDSRKLLTLIATLASDAVRASSEKLGIANAVYHTVDNHLTALNAIIAQHKATLPRPPTPTPPPVLPEPSSPVPPIPSPSLKIRTRRKAQPEEEPDPVEEEAEQSPTHESIPPLRLTRTGMTASNTTPTTIRIRGKPKPKPDEPTTAARPRSVSMSKGGSGSSTKGGATTTKPATPRHSSGGSNKGTGSRTAPKAAPRNRPPGKSHKKAAGVEGPEEEMEVDPNEEKYCHCNQVSFGEMIGCDGVDCPYEWFHLPCVGLDKAPAADSAWFCPDCAKNGRKRRRKG